ncbi:hypothetical protein RhiirA4_417375 [Rhizophagus irregularis]|uniref:Uncharacterized protein n=1 Tax=Rhizophagus irregularis TaxID=588596 RepID=A0A2I1G6N9_9GLOM|nr:hypothetical protein RhiirA4_417375 [Rhizophagus irregularis]
MRIYLKSAIEYIRTLPIGDSNYSKNIRELADKGEIALKHWNSFENAEIAIANEQLENYRYLYLGKTCIANKSQIICDSAWLSTIGLIIIGHIILIGIILILIILIGLLILIIIIIIGIIGREKILQKLIILVWKK